MKRGYDGVGFCLTPPYIGVHLDSCRQPNGYERGRMKSSANWTATANSARRATACV